MFERAKGIVRKVTLEVIYEVVEGRSREIYEKLEKIERRQEENFRYLSQRIDQTNQVRTEISQVNHRIDTVIQMLSEIMRR